MLMYGDLMLIHFLSQRQAVNQSTLRKPAQPHKPKGIDPNLEILNGLTVYNNFKTN